MLKKMIKYIFIYTICVITIGCDNPMSPQEEYCDYCYLELEAPNLPMDENGIYHLDYIDDALQTFTQLKAYVGYEVFEKNKFYVVYQRMVGEDKIIDEQIYISTDEFDALLGEFYNKAEEQLETGPKEN